MIKSDKSDNYWHLNHHFWNQQWPIFITPVDLSGYLYQPSMLSDVLSTHAHISNYVDHAGTIHLQIDHFILPLLALS